MWHSSNMCKLKLAMNLLHHFWKLIIYLSEFLELENKQQYSQILKELNGSIKEEKMCVYFYMHTRTKL